MVQVDKNTEARKVVRLKAKSQKPQPTKYDMDDI